MRFLVIVEADAEQDWDEAVMWYDDHEPGVSQRLNIAIRAVLHTLADQPERFSRATRLTRNAKMLSPWPYSVYFTINEEHREVKVLAIWHGARNPEELRRRVK